jgi:hypothetical protein
MMITKMIGTMGMSMRNIMAVVEDRDSRGGGNNYGALPTKTHEALRPDLVVRDIRLSHMHGSVSLSFTSFLG